MRKNLNNEFKPKVAVGEGSCKTLWSDLSCIPIRSANGSIKFKECSSTVFEASTGESEKEGLETDELYAKVLIPLYKFTKTKAFKNWVHSIRLKPNRNLLFKSCKTKKRFTIFIPVV